MYTMYCLSVVKKLATEMSPVRRVRRAYGMLGANVKPCWAQMSGANVGRTLKNLFLIQAHSLRNSAVMFKISLNNKKH